MTYRVLPMLGIGLAVTLLALTLISMVDDFATLVHVMEAK